MANVWRNTMKIVVFTDRCPCQIGMTEFSHNDVYRCPVTEHVKGPQDSLLQKNSQNECDNKTTLCRYSICRLSYGFSKVQNSEFKKNWDPAPEGLVKFLAKWMGVWLSENK
ncbi:hypothetical protein CEXT_805481 [Caerostris extrusa]|uniref:Uncharacterized protein n=1 Tax=Caerostris extrusa TaxID=172846 RepID=A0AAV4WCN3_CAEEX|nr:hypothetical protein CEXT_805481 [Caerostris extrusa]